MNVLQIRPYFRLWVSCHFLYVLVVSDSCLSMAFNILIFSQLITMSSEMCNISVFFDVMFLLVIRNKKSVNYTDFRDDDGETILLQNAQK